MGMMSWEHSSLPPIIYRGGHTQLSPIIVYTVLPITVVMPGCGVGIRYIQPERTKAIQPSRICQGDTSGLSRKAMSHSQGQRMKNSFTNKLYKGLTAVFLSLGCTSELSGEHLKNIDAWTLSQTYGSRNWGMKHRHMDF